MGSRPEELVDRWCDLAEVDPACRPDPVALRRAFPDAFRPPADSVEIEAWERRHGYLLPPGLKQWLGLSNGLFADGPLIHPLSAIGPMVPFARMPGLIVQPESWFELGNPNVETVCVDLGYRWPRGDYPIFRSGDDASGSASRVIAPDFNSWFLGVLSSAGREYWFDPGFRDLGDPWLAHLRYVPAPVLSDRLRPLADRVFPLVRAGVDDRAIAGRFGISPFDVEAIARHLQHASPATVRAANDARTPL